MNSDEEPKIKVVINLEVVGKPPEHLVESLKRVMEEIDKEKGITILRKDIKEPRPMKDQEGFFTTFAEVELEVEDIRNFVIVMFKYMPAHLEIVSPEIIAISNNSWSDILNELIRRVHGYDEIARMLQHENSLLRKKLEDATGEKVTTPMSPIENLGKKPKKKLEKKSKPKKIKKKEVIVDKEEVIDQLKEIEEERIKNAQEEIKKTQEKAIEKEIKVEEEVKEDIEEIEEEAKKVKKDEKDK